MSKPTWFLIYGRMPVALQNLACSLGGLRTLQVRYNRRFHQKLQLLEASDRWSLTELQAYQDERLGELIRHAYENVPYYRAVFDERKLKPVDIRTAADLCKLPVLEKKTVRERFDDLVATNWRNRFVRHGRTGGTTGTALQLAYAWDEWTWTTALWWRFRGRFGCKWTDSNLNFGGRDVVPLERMDPPFWRRNLPMRQTYISVHHLTRQNMPALVDYMQRRNVAYYIGYPSALYLVASYLVEHNIRLAHPPRVTFCNSETLLPHHRRAIAEAFQCRVADHYGATEACVGISECEHGGYHVAMEYGVVELLEDNALPATSRHIICTGLCNPAMPLIRYRIGDMAEHARGQCACRRESPVVGGIDGRIESYVVTPDGRRLGRLDFLFKKSDRISEAQLVQDRADHVTIRIVRSPQYDQADEHNLLVDVREYLGTQVEIELEYLAGIPREPNGKFRQIVSNVDIRG